ncbi:HDIG domain-containing metalloprotein [Alkaliphilus serpentinus]|uniref:HD domain-containing protein n=1 Tax=Alkaliphilus serpentinus TaxID=1482731 RepID=A0A833HQK1_9FIRM|nr:HDIG domain-containing metalloprotein [Alkaliphilus serpentinus]KAB3531817.1 HD domain-containing protein [Alkaliphilus serpentinus]
MINIYDILVNAKNTLSLRAYIVGGSLRDILIGKNVKDYDLVVDKNPRGYAEAIATELKGRFIILDEEQETFRVILDSKEFIDISRMKGKSIIDDLKHRDFTINAMAYDVDNSIPIIKEKILDPYNGMKDLDRKLIKHLTEETFEADPIRMLRAVRFMAALDFSLDEDTIQQITKNASSIKRVSGERVSYELFEILKSNKSYYYLSYMDKELKLLDKIFPDIEEMKKVGECKYHVVNSWTHSIYTVKVAENVINEDGFFEKHIKRAFEEHTRELIAADRSRLQLIKLGALFHDIGKPSAMKIDSSGRTRFRGHEITGTKIVKGYSEALKLSTLEKNILQKYVYLHMLPLVSYKNNDVSGRALYNIFSKMGEETLDILLIAFADIVATRRLLDPHEEMGMIKIHVEYIANNYLTRYKPLEKISAIITGKEIMDTLNIPEGEEVGMILEEVKKAIYFGEISSSKEAVIEYIKGIKAVEDLKKQ